MTVTYTLHKIPTLATCYKSVALSTLTMLCKRHHLRCVSPQTPPITSTPSLPFARPVRTVGGDMAEAHWTSPIRNPLLTSVSPQEPGTQNHIRVCAPLPRSPAHAHPAGCALQAPRLTELSFPSFLQDHTDLGCSPSRHGRDTQTRRRAGLRPVLANETSETLKEKLVF